MDPLLRSVHATEDFFWHTLSRARMQRDGLRAFACGPHSRYLNPVLSPEFSSVALEHLEAVRAFYREQGLPWCWMLPAAELTPALRLVMGGLGLESRGQSPVMLYRFGGAFRPEFRQEVREVHGAGLADWDLPLQEGFPGDERETRAYQAVHAAAERRAPGALRHFVAYAGAEPVAAATLSLSPAGARIDDVATRTAHLRRGFGRAVTLRARLEARAAGYPWCCLGASEEGFPLYRSLGFEVLYLNETFTAD